MMRLLPCGPGDRARREGHGSRAARRRDYRLTRCAAIVSATVPMLTGDRMNPVLVEATRATRASRRIAAPSSSLDADGKRLVGARRRRAAGLSALGGQGAAGDPAGRERRRRPPRASTTRSSRSPARRTTASPSTSPWSSACSPRPGSTSARSNAAPTGRAIEPVAHAIAAAGREPTALHNNCSGKHAGFLCLACAAVRRRRPAPVREGLRRAAPSGDARRHRGAAGGDRPRPGAGAARHRRLLDPDLRDPARPPRPRLRPHRHRHRPAPRPCARRRALRQAVARAAVHGRRQRAASTPR